MQQLKALEAENPSLITPDSPTQRVGGKPREGFVKVAHSSPMLSLDNTYNEDELRDWERRVHELSGRSDVDYVCELKLDGMSLALIYEDGKLVRGVTRGDGSVGEDVTLNIRTVRSIPLSIPKEKLKKAGMPPDFEVRGELLMPTASFKKINEERERAGLATFANPRNFTAGTVRQLDANITAARRLDYFPYILLKNGRTYFDRHSKTLAALDTAGFKVNPNHKLVHSMDEVWAFIQQWEGEARLAALRNRRHRRESRPHRTAGRTRLHRQSPALGHRLQIRRARRRHPTEECSLADWPHRQTDPGRGVGADSDRRHDRSQRDLAQHGRNPASRPEDRRLGSSRAWRRRDPEGRRGRQRSSARRNGNRNSGEVLGLRNESRPHRGRSRLPLRQRQLPRQTAGHDPALRLARRDEHRRHGRSAGHATHRERPGQECRRHLQAHQERSARPGALRRQVRAKHSRRNRELEEASARARDLRTRHSHGRRAHGAVSRRTFRIDGSALEPPASKNCRTSTKSARASPRASSNSSAIAANRKLVERLGEAGLTFKGKKKERGTKLAGKTFVLTGTLPTSPATKPRR